jgi:acyl-CoA reductase-like NAD-dependent aldehyde dehydrogenase
MITRYPLFIDGEFKDSRERQAIVNPANCEVIAEAALADNEDIESAISSARNAFDKGTWRDLSVNIRKSFLLRISQGIIERAAELAKIETLNTGKPIKESTFMDVPSAAKAFEHIANNLERYLKEETLQVENASSRLMRQPRGVVVLIVPWNYPLLIASWKLASALAAGNTVVLKPSSLTPLSVLELAKVIKEAGLPKGVVNIVNAEGGKAGKALCADKRVDMVSFTGSNEVGKQIMAYSCEHIKKMIMELGGKSASIVLKDADLELAVNGSLCSIFLNQGQMCTAMSRILVEDDIYDDFLNNFLQKVKRIKLGNGLDYETQMGPLISRAQRDKVISYVQKAEAQGAKLICGGKIPSDSALSGGFFFEPTVFDSAPVRSAIFQEEVFGPVVCVNKFSLIDEAIHLANESDFALAAAVWTRDADLAASLAAKINAGTVWINTYGMFFNELPYGGFKQSGFGKELGREGFLEYTSLKNIIIDASRDSKPLVNYWYGF